MQRTDAAVAVEMTPRRRRQRGVSLVETIAAIGVATIVLCAVYAAMTSQTDAADAGVRLMLAKNECDRALLVLLEDLQTTNTVEKDQSGTPYFEILDAGEGQGQKIRFRRVEGFDAGAASDTVSPRYGSAVTYSLNDRSQLVRSKDGEDRIVANGVAACAFSATAGGTIACRLRTFSGAAAERTEVENSIAVTPRNGYDR